MNYKQLQTISKLDLEGKWVLVRFRGTTNDKSLTTNDFEARSWGKMTQLEFLANYKRKKINYKQLHTISKLVLKEKWVLVRFRGTTNDKSTTTNDFEARARRKMGLRSFSRNYKRQKHNYKRFQNSGSKKNGFSFVFEELKTMKTQLRTISKLDLGVK